MIGLDICSWQNDSSNFCLLYRTEFLLAIFSFLLSFFILSYAFSGDRFNPHTAIMRGFIFGDVVACFANLLEAMSSLIPKDLQIGRFISPPDAQFIPVSSCVLYRSHIFLFSMARQWIAVLAFIVGIERFLFVCYPLWFRVIRVHRAPVIMFLIFFVSMSASIGYTNGLVVVPNEKIHFTCEWTWSFGDDYGWAQSILIIACLVSAVFFNIYAHNVVAEEQALAHFGNNRIKIMSERRKIKKAMWILSFLMIFCGVPQLIVVILRLCSRWNLQNLKLIANQLFMLKALANVFMVWKLGRGRTIWQFASRVYCGICRSVRSTQVADSSISSISKYVH